MVGTTGVGGLGACTLLGPEGPGAVPAAGRISVRVRGGGGLDSSGLREAERFAWWSGGSGRLLRTT